MLHFHSDLTMVPPGRAHPTCGDASVQNPTGTKRGSLHDTPPLSQPRPLSQSHARVHDSLCEEFRQRTAHHQPAERVAENVQADVRARSQIRLVRSRDHLFNKCGCQELYTD